MLFAIKGEIAEHLPHPLAEAADLNEPGPDAVPETDADEQKHQNVVGKVRVDVAYNGVEYAVQLCNESFHDPCPPEKKRSG